MGEPSPDIRHGTKLISAMRVLFVACGFLLLQLAVQVYLLCCYKNEIPVSRDMVIASDIALRLMGFLYIIILLISVVFFIIWFKRIYSNLKLRVGAKIRRINYWWLLWITLCATPIISAFAFSGYSLTNLIRQSACSALSAIVSMVLIYIAIIIVKKHSDKEEQSSQNMNITG
ncbi:hypothetical protein [Dysgonomonas sp. 511]|uniref:hypothetical protein n=1 Tax=Dysgonomonas sp. 511 TaxID=2302930 RepID=UPI0013D8D45B|nr:hypothetical protein [Dysgonomonas sp. 511]NDV78878.1 hypothetical protein [Dysgonomonas sp. 511]